MFTPQIHMFTPQIRMSTSQICMFTPQIHMSTPQIHMFKRQNRMFTPQTHMFTPQIHMSTQQIHMSTTDPHVASQIHVFTPQIHMSTSQIPTTHPHHLNSLLKICCLSKKVSTFETKAFQCSIFYSLLLCYLFMVFAHKLLLYAKISSSQFKKILISQPVLCV